MNFLSQIVFPLSNSVPIFRIPFVSDSSNGSYKVEAQLVQGPNSPPFCKPGQDSSKYPCLDPNTFFVKNNPVTDLISKTLSASFFVNGTPPLLSFSQDNISGSFNMTTPSLQMSDSDENTEITFNGHTGVVQYNSGDAPQIFAYNFNYKSRYVQQSIYPSGTNNSTIPWTPQGGVTPSGTSAPVSGYFLSTNQWWESNDRTTLLYIFIEGTNGKYYSGYVLITSWNYPNVIRGINNVSGNLTISTVWDNSGNNYIYLPSSSLQYGDTVTAVVSYVQLPNNSPFTQTNQSTPGNIITTNQFWNNIPGATLVYLEVSSGSNSWNGYMVFSEYHTPNVLLDSFRVGGNMTFESGWGQNNINYVQFFLNGNPVSGLNYNIKSASLIPPLKYNELDITDVFTFLNYNGTTLFFSFINPTDLNQYYIPLGQTYNCSNTASQSSQATQGICNLNISPNPVVNSTILSIIQAVSPAVSGFMYAYLNSKLTGTPPPPGILNNGITLRGGTGDFEIFQFTFDPSQPIEYPQPILANLPDNYGRYSNKVTVTTQYLNLPYNIQNPFGLDVLISLVFVYFIGTNQCQYIGYIVSGVDTSSESEINTGFTSVVITGSLSPASSESNTVTYV